jgi:putative DNA primase/helicase
VNRRLIVSKENEQTQRLKTEFIKSLTGDEEIPVRHPYGRPFKFQPVAKSILIVNHKPTIVDETHGMWRRVRMVPFLRTFLENPAFADSLVAEAPAVLAWAVEGAVRYYGEGLKTPQLVLDATVKYRQECDSLTPFFEECCVFGTTLRTKAQPMFEELRDWYNQRQTPQFERLSQKEFGRRIAEDKRITVTKGKGEDRFTVFYVGVGLISQPKWNE